MPLFGTLKSMPLPDLLQWLGNARRTGTLQVERHKISKSILFKDGEVVGCSSDDPPQRLGHFLLSRGKITEDHLREALARQEKQRKHLGMILVEMNVIPPDELSDHLEAKAEETIYSLFDWDDAVFRFDANLSDEANIFPISLRVEDVLLRGLKRYDEVQQIRTVFNDPGIVLRHTQISPPEEIFANRMARTLYEAIDGDRSVAQLLLHVHGSEYVVTKFLYELHRNGLVTVAGVKSIVPVANTEEQVETAPSIEPPAAGSEAQAATLETESASGTAGTPSPPIGPAPETAAPGDNDPSLTSGAEAPGASDAESLSVVEDAPLTVSDHKAPASSQDAPPTVSDGKGPAGDEVERAAPEAAPYSVEAPGLSDTAAPSPSSSTSPAQLPAPTEDLLADWEPNVDLPLDGAAPPSPDDSPPAASARPESQQPDAVVERDDSGPPAGFTTKDGDDAADEESGGLESLEKSDAHRLVSQLEAARRRMAKAEFEEALDILDGLYRQFPGDESLRRMSAEAEAAFVERAYRHYLPPTKVPALTKPMEELECENLSPTEFFLLSRIDGSWDVKSIIQIAPLREADALRTLKRMRENGVIVLHEPQPVSSD